MIAETQGIVLNYIKYKETSIIVRIYTLRYGLKSFIVNGIRSKKAKKSIGLFQPFTLLEIQLYYNENRDLLRLSDAKISSATPSISQQIIKSTVALFITEILGKTLSHEHHENAELYTFLKTSVLTLDQLTQNVEDFHLLFLIKYSSHLGLDLTDSETIDHVELSHTQVCYLNDLISMSFEHLAEEYQSTGSGDTRMACLEAILAHYRQHLDGISDIKSLKVLHQVFH